MDITPLIPQGRKVLNGYGGGSFTVNEEDINGNIFISPENVISWNVNNPEEITSDDFAELLSKEKDIELILIGCGEKHKVISSELRNYFRSRDINVEMMTTSAACRTYNVLLSEERKVSAALIAV